MVSIMELRRETGISHGVGRRGFLSVMAGSGIGAAGATVGASAIGRAIGEFAHFATEVPPITVHETPVSGSFDIAAGWIESKSADLPALDKSGSFSFFFNTVFNNPETVELGRDFLTKLDHLLQLPQQIQPGDALLYVTEGADLILKDKKIAEDTTRNIEVGHLAMYGLATGLNHRWSKEQLQKLGVPMTGYKSEKEYFFGPHGLQTNVFPEAFGAPDPHDIVMAKLLKESIGRGPDRWGHIAAFAWVGFMIRYAHDHDVPFLEKTPRLAQWLVRSLPPEEQGERVATWGGIAYELSGLVKLQNWPLIGGQNWQDIDEGLWDKTSKDDVDGNLLGVRLGNRVYDLLKSAPLDQDPVAILAPLAYYLNTHPYPRGSKPEIVLPK